MKMKPILLVLLCATAITCLFACEKAKDLIPGGTLSFNLNDTLYESSKLTVSGSITTDTTSTMLVISGSNNAGWAVTINVQTNEPLKPGTYTSAITPMNALGWSMILAGKNYDSFNEGAVAGNATIVINKVTSTHAEGTFSGTIINDLNPDDIKVVSNGKFDVSITP